MHEVEELDVKQRENTPRWPQLSAEAGKPAAYRTIDKQARARETISSTAMRHEQGVCDAMKLRHKL